MVDNSFQIKDSFPIGDVVPKKGNLDEMDLPALPILKVSEKQMKINKMNEKKNAKNDDRKNNGKKSDSPLVKKVLNEKELAMDFAEKVQKKFDRVVKASVLFGSQAKNTATVGSDVDIILIIDDASIEWDLELVSWYREELSKLISGSEYPSELHINTVRLTTWWEDLMHGDPVVINILRYGEALIDYGGFFNPLKALLQKGKIRSTPEAVHAALQRAPWHLARSRASEMGAVEGVYWAMVDAAHAALITGGKLPPSPEHIPELLKETFVDAGMLKMSQVNAMRDIYLLHKGILHGDITHVKGEDIDKWQAAASNFLLDMTRIIDSLLEGKI